MNRREFIAAAAAFAAVGAKGEEAVQAGGRRIRLAAQMYSVRGVIDDAEGFRTMLRLMKKFGYDGVELCGSWMGAKELKEFLDRLGLACAGAHVGLAACLPAAVSKTCDDALACGNDKIVMPWAEPPKDCQDVEGFWRRLGEDLSKSAEIAKARGVHLLYHNHGHEFTRRIGERTLWDLMFAESSPALEFQIDVGHLALAGVNATRFFARYPDRIRTIHAKPFVERVDWREIGEVTRRNVTEWYVVEAEADPWDTGKMKRGADIVRAKCPFLG